MTFGEVCEHRSLKRQCERCERMAESNGWKQKFHEAMNDAKSYQEAHLESVEQLNAADALAKAAKDAHNNLLYSAPLKPHVAATQRAEKLLRNALATYEKVRNSK